MIRIQNGYYMDPATGTEGALEVLLDGDLICKVATSEEMEAYLAKEQKQPELLDANGRVIAPGLVDVHVHFRDPGFTYKEDIETGARAAAAGGFTTVVLMANTKPVVDNEETLLYVLNKGKEQAIRIESCASVSMNLAGEKMTDMEALRKLGAAGFTDDGIPLMEEDFVREAMKKTAQLSVPISFHEEDKTYISENGINAGKVSEHFGIGGSPRQAEISLIERDLKLAIETGAIIDIQHISTKEGVELVRQARKQSKNIHAEATPHHIALTEEAVIEKGTLAKMNPPLRTREDQRAIIEGLKDGTIEIIATDHAPHSTEEKEKPLTQAPSGIIGLETAFSVCNTVLVESGEMTMMSLLDRMSLGPARMYGLKAGSIAEGCPADLILIDPKEKWRPTEYLSKSKNTPFTGVELTGRVHTTICKGQIVYHQS